MNRSLVFDSAQVAHAVVHFNKYGNYMDNTHYQIDARKGEMNHEGMDHGAMGHSEMNHESMDMNHESMNHDAMGHRE